MLVEENMSEKFESTRDCGILHTHIYETFNHSLHSCTHTRPYTYLYIYTYMCVCAVTSILKHLQFCRPYLELLSFNVLKRDVIFEKRLDQTIAVFYKCIYYLDIIVIICC